MIYDVDNSRECVGGPNDGAKVTKAPHFFAEWKMGDVAVIGRAIYVLAERPHFLYGVEMGQEQYLRFEGYE